MGNRKKNTGTREGGLIFYSIFSFDTTALVIDFFDTTLEIDCFFFRNSTQEQEGPTGHWN